MGFFSLELSDVYVFGSGSHLECVLSHRDASIFGLPRLQQFSYEWGEECAQSAMYHYLLFLREKGLNVPNSALKRLRSELRDAKYPCAYKALWKVRKPVSSLMYKKPLWWVTDLIDRLDSRLTTKAILKRNEWNDRVGIDPSRLVKGT